ncbi:CcmD family protein [Mucilaginibacter segetis]|uniref:CcmD family protein n=1 Tax=Mucilaginibacter segetis TaxID=2793071 RepID=A0A934PT20_9SPHI|nr:CcmD family protein [Mucilaginibacter segetis]MBK0379002.1 CcmD family protein [Mucilaginibacter segetis]
MRKLTLLILLLCCFFGAFAQQTQTVEMADVMRSSGKIYVVIAVIAIIFAGIAIYLFSIDRRLKRIEKEK